MSTWLDRFALTLLAAILGAAVLTNPWKLDRVQHSSLIVAIVALSVFAARTIERLRSVTGSAPLIESVVRDNTPTTASVQTADVFLLPPVDTVIGIEWVPKRSYAIQIRAINAQGTILSDSRPQMRLKNMGPLPVTDIEVRWSVTGEPIAGVFTQAVAFQRFKPRIEDGFLFFMTDPDATREIGIPVTDEALSTLPFAPATPTSDDSSPLPLPGEILNNLAIRMVTEVPRPKPWEFFFYGPDVSAEILYRIGAVEKRATFIVRSKVMYFGDMAGGLGTPTLIPTEFGPDNFRGNITFEIVKPSSSEQPMRPNNALEPSARAK